jgi:hypothetical protein
MSLPIPHVPRVAVEIHVTASFAADFGELERQIGAESKTVYDQILSALLSIREQKPHDTLPITPYGLYGDSFQYKLNEEYVFTFKKVTDRDSERKPILFHYFFEEPASVKGPLGRQYLIDQIEQEAERNQYKPLPGKSQGTACQPFVNRAPRIQWLSLLIGYQVRFANRSQVLD